MRTRNRYLVMLALWPALLACIGGCEQTDNRVVVVVAVAGFSPEEELDRLEVTVAASATETGDSLCTPYSRLFAVDPGDATDLPPVTFPLRIAIQPGSVYDKILYVRVRGWQSGSLRLKSERMVSLQGGDVELQILLPRDCLGVGTGAGQHCLGGLAMESPYWPIFDDGLNVEPGAPSCVEE